MNNNLRPEVRINKKGVPVTKHVRDQASKNGNGLLSRLIPFGGRNLESQESKENRQKVASRLRELYISGQSDFYDRIDEHYGEAKRARDNEDMDRFFKKTSTGILELVSATITDGEDFRNFIDYFSMRSQAIIKSYCLYRHCGVSSHDWKRVSADVASSLKVDDLGAFEYGTDEHTRISAVVTYAKEAYWARHSKFMSTEPSYRDVDYSLDKLGEQEQAIHQMTPALAGVAIDFPDRAKEVAEYLAARDFTPDNFDEEHLRMMLSTPSRAMNSGIL